MRTLSPRLAAGFVLDNPRHALLRLKAVREQLNLLVGRREGERAASCHLLLPELCRFHVRVKFGYVVITVGGKSHQVLARMSKNNRALKRAALFPSLIGVKVNVDLLAGGWVNKNTLLLALHTERGLLRLHEAECPVGFLLSADTLA